MKISLLILLGLTLAFMVQTGEGSKPKPCLQEAKDNWKVLGQRCNCDDGDAYVKPDCGAHIKECHPHKCTRDKYVRAWGINRN
jgi:hypothetical protein